VGSVTVPGDTHCSSVKRTLAKQCQESIIKKTEEVENRVIVKGRLKDKLMVLKAKMANTVEEI